MMTPWRSSITRGPGRHRPDSRTCRLQRVWPAARPADGLPPALAALRDPFVGAAVTALHTDPARPWTTASLADELAVSRATLARRFPAAVGEPPVAYLTRWRMELAAQRLRETDAPLAAVARSVGDASVHAVDRAFRRERGEPPGRYRGTARAAAPGRSPSPAPAGR